MLYIIRYNILHINLQRSISTSNLITKLANIIGYINTNTHIDRLDLMIGIKKFHCIYTNSSIL